MSKIISVHSFRGGTGKSNLTANVATSLGLMGKRVGIIDTDIQSPGIHVIFGLGEESMTRALNDYLWGECAIEETAYDVTPGKVRGAGGAIHLIPSSIRPGEIARVLREGYDVTRLIEGIRALMGALALDVMMIDTHPGLNEETLLSITISDALVIVLRPDSQDYQGTAVTVEVARQLEVPRMMLVVNKVPAGFDPEAVREKVIEAYGGAPVAAVLPLTEEVVRLASSGVFCLEYPDHPLARQIAQLTRQVIA